MCIAFIINNLINWKPSAAYMRTHTENNHSNLSFVLLAKLNQAFGSNQWTYFLPSEQLREIFV